MKSSNCMISGKYLFPVIEELLEEGKKAKFTVSGNSMWPFIINNRDSVVLTKCDTKHLKKGDIILFEPFANHYVLHRITKVLEGGYITTGDGNLHHDGFVPVDKVKAKVEIICRNKREIDCGKLRWKLVFRLWMAGFPIRYYLQKLVIKLWGFFN